MRDKQLQQSPMHRLIHMKNTHYPSNINFPENIHQWLDILHNGSNDHQRYLLSTDSKELVKIYKQAIALNALSIAVPEEIGGSNLDSQAQYYYYKNVAMASGTLAFLFGQHISAMASIASGNNTLLKSKYLTQNLDGRYSFGISFGHLKHSITPPVTAIEQNDAYIVNGVLPYVTGYKIFNTLIIGFVCDDREIMAAVASTTNTLSETCTLLKQHGL